MLEIMQASSIMNKLLVISARILHVIHLRSDLVRRLQSGGSLNYLNQVFVVKTKPWVCELMDSYSKQVHIPC